MFSPNCEVFDLQNPNPVVTKKEDNIECIRQALVLGLRDYADKSGFSKGLVGLSGGIDSAVTAALAVEALGQENIIGISLPSFISNTVRMMPENLHKTWHYLPLATHLAPSIPRKQN